MDGLFGLVWSTWCTQFEILKFPAKIRQKINELSGRCAEIYILVSQRVAVQKIEKRTLLKLLYSYRINLGGDG